MYKLVFLLLVFYTACTLPEEKKARQSSQKSDTTVMEASDANTATLDTSNAIYFPVIKKIKSPSGVYQAILPNKKLEQIIAFNSDLTYLLQEKYFSEGSDSVVITEGTWTPSDGFVWLYKDQIERGRYRWKGETLQYYSPLLKKNFSMRHLKDAMQNAAWRDKGKKGITVFGTGNEPFWKIELDNKDSLSFLLSEWNRPLKLKVDSSFSSKDSIGYITKNDSAQIRVTIFPHFCSDGMSDFIYRNKVQIRYDNHVYNGCGILYK